MEKRTKAKIILALDTKDLTRAVSLINLTKNYIAMVKLGLEFFVANGPAGVRFVQQQTNIPIFLDLKLLDIPNTVKGAVEAANDLKVKMLTVHLSGGPMMLDYAVKSSKNSDLILTGVTVLTSLESSVEQVMGLVDLADRCKIGAVVCSANEVGQIKDKYPNIITVVPGISLDVDGNVDQTRSASPERAAKNGADFLVIGRSISNSSDPAGAAKMIYEMI